MKKLLMLAFVLMQVGSHAATPTHTYTFASGLEDSSGTLPIIAEGGVVVGGRYEFGQNQGLTLDSALSDVSTFSIEMVFQLSEMDIFYNKLIDFSELNLDSGLYALGSAFGNQIQFYSGLGTGTSSVVAQTDYALVLTRDADGTTSVYLDGVLQFSEFNEFSLPAANVLTFFVDDIFTNQVEAAAGSVDYIKIYDVALSANDVESLVGTDEDLVTRDLFEVGDGLITFDPRTNREWLDLTQTINYSVNDVLNGVGGWTDLGFTVATAAEVTSFWEAVGIADIGAETVSNAVGVQSSFDFNGCTWSCGGANFERTNALSIDDTIVRVAALDLILSNTPNTGNVRFSGATSDFDYRAISAGVYLHREAQELDSDFDGVVDSEDNCVTASNADQRDTDSDGFGNRCDPDLNNDGIINFADIALWAPFFNTVNNGNEDFNGDGAANFADYALFAEFFLLSPGPGNGEL